MPYIFPVGFELCTASPIAPVPPTIEIYLGPVSGSKLTARRLIRADISRAPAMCSTPPANVLSAIRGLGKYEYQKNERKFADVAGISELCKVCETSSAVYSRALR